MSREHLLVLIFFIAPILPAQAAEPVKIAIVKGGHIQNFKPEPVKKVQQPAGVFRAEEVEKWFTI